MPLQQTAPDVLAMILADGLHGDNASGKSFILGTYSTINARHFPCTKPDIHVYLALTDGHGRTTLKLRFIDVDESREPVFEHEMEVDFDSPLAVREVLFTRRHVVIPQPGEYRLQLFGAGQFLRERRVLVLPLSTPTAVAEKEAQPD